MRTLAFRAHLVHVLALLVPLVGLGGVGAMLYLAFHDDLLASVMARQTAQQYAYEDRIDALRGELERQSRRHAGDQTAVEDKMRELGLRQSKLEGRAALVASLTARAGLTRASEAGGSPAGTPASVPRLSTALELPFGNRPGPTAMPEQLLSYAPASTSLVPAWAAAKPHPENDPAETEAVKVPGPVSALDDRKLAVPSRLALISASLDRVEQVQVDSLRQVGARARNETTRLHGILQEAGLSLERFRAPVGPAMGGPFVPLGDEKDTPFRHAVLDLQTSLASETHLKDVVAQVPFEEPLPGAPEITSPFGARTDPFLGRPALHTGVDLKEGLGVSVRSTAAGRVAFAGVAGGYGNMVEIDHGNGLTTRYAHLSEIAVSQGQVLGKGEVIGRVGATGRATGPHLHYEVRIDGEPVDPVRFLNAGIHLASATAH